MEPGQSYHIYNHANGVENIFREKESYRFFLQQYEKYLGPVVETFAYCLMPNHFHFLVKVRSDLPGFQNLAGLSTKGHSSKNPVTKAFSDFFNSYTKAINKKFERRGSLFIKNFQRKPIETEKQWQVTFLYILLNPIKHGFVKDLNHWKWSSWLAYNNMDRYSFLNRVEYKVYFDHWNHVEYMIDCNKEIIMNLDMK